MREPPEDNLAFEMEMEGTGTEPGPLWIQSKFANKGLGEQRASEPTESLLRFNRRDQHLAHVSCARLKSLFLCDYPFVANCYKLKN